MMKEKHTTMYPRLRILTLAMALSGLCLMSSARSAPAADMDALKADCEGSRPQQCHKYGLQLLHDTTNKAHALEAAIAAWQRGCEAKDGESCSALAASYHRGRGVTRDVQKAVELLRQACELQSASACLQLGVSYVSGGFELNTDYLKGAQLLKKGCSLGNATACYRLGMMHERGLGLVRSSDMADHYYELACDLGNDEGCGAMGTALAGQGSMAEARRNADPGELKKSCDAGNGADCTTLGNIYRNGLQGVNADPATALMIFKQGCDSGNGAACAQLSSMYHLGQAVPADDMTGNHYASQACELKDAEGCFLLASNYRNGVGGLNRDHRHAAKLFAKACALNSAPACQSLGRSYLYGQGVTPDLEQARRYLEHACELKLNDACREVRELR